MDEWKIEENDFGELLPFIKDKKVTDIDYNGYDLWITDLELGRYKSVVKISEDFLNTFAEKVSNISNMGFNKIDNTLEAQTDKLRITLTHPEVSRTGLSLEIRKALPETRHTTESMLETGYCDLATLNLLINCMKARMNFVFCGEPGVGKTECAKFFARFIPEEDRIITIEDNLEMHLHEIYPEKDVIELLINKDFNYQDAISHCLRKHPKWIVLSETRGREAKYLLQQWSTGLKGLTTLHVDDLRNLPDRYMNMIGKTEDADRLENSIYEYISVGVGIRKREIDGKIQRYMDQVALFDRSNGRNQVYLLVNEGKRISCKIPDRINRVLERAGIKDPFKCNETIEFELPDVDLVCIKKEA